MQATNTVTTRYLAARVTLEAPDGRSSVGSALNVEGETMFEVLQRVMHLFGLEDPETVEWTATFLPGKKPIVTAIDHRSFESRNLGYVFEFLKFDPARPDLRADLSPEDLPEGYGIDRSGFNYELREALHYNFTLEDDPVYA
jgi:hypothetical protein